MSLLMMHETCCRFSTTKKSNEDDLWVYSVDSSNFFIAVKNLLKFEFIIVWGNNEVLLFSP